MRAKTRVAATLKALKASAKKAKAAGFAGGGVLSFEDALAAATRADAEAPGAKRKRGRGEAGPPGGDEADGGAGGEQRKAKKKKTKKGGAAAADDGGGARWDAADDLEAAGRAAAAVAAAGGGGAAEAEESPCCLVCYGSDAPLIVCGAPGCAFGGACWACYKQWFAARQEEKGDLAGALVCMGGCGASIDAARVAAAGARKGETQQLSRQARLARVKHADSVHRRDTMEIVVGPVRHPTKVTSDPFRTSHAGSWLQTDHWRRMIMSCPGPSDVLSASQTLFRKSSARSAYARTPVRLTACPLRRHGPTDPPRHPTTGAPVPPALCRRCGAEAALGGRPQRRRGCPNVRELCPAAGGVPQGAAQLVAPEDGEAAGRAAEEQRPA